MKLMRLRSVERARIGGKSNNRVELEVELEVTETRGGTRLKLRRLRSVERARIGGKSNNRVELEVTEDS